MVLKDTTTTKKEKYENKNMMRKGNNLFMCFRPVVLEPDGSGREINDPFLTYIAVQRNKESVVFPKKALSEKDDEKSLSFEAIKEEDFPAGKKIGGSRRFSHVLKAVLFEASMARKIKKGKSDKKSSHSLSESARYSYQKSSHKDQFDFDFGFGQRIISRTASALATSPSASTATSYCPSCSSSLVAKPTSFASNSTESKPTYENVKQQYRQRGYDTTCKSGLFLMLISLLVLVFWGKICAIVYTSTWFCFVARWINVKVMTDLTDPSENSSECKRKIVMEGLLARERGSFPC
ncbi:hypothetical protein L484_006607 [Morus notabilis]|uniref:Uncharacterized protein n=1 Tax=Morus notabilis TaxID=981085 RepID=W9RV64_9ROSA|nr:uncharacterized protein LOC21390032 [Morus notabilis]EXC12063.1 hypothetical protein L484_006607 [Morus notabilis]